MVANTSVSALKSHAAGDRHNCILKEWKKKLFFTSESNVNSEAENCKIQRKSQ